MCALYKAFYNKFANWEGKSIVLSSQASNRCNMAASLYGMAYQPMTDFMNQREGKGYTAGKVPVTRSVRSGEQMQKTMMAVKLSEPGKSSAFAWNMHCINFREVENRIKGKGKV
eukprot:1157388-Pelagomonas_calceolata.AAC.25